MNLFYCDDIIKVYECELNFTPVIEHLERLFDKTCDDTLLATLIGVTWYYLIEGNVNQSPINYDWALYQSKWKQYIDLGLEKFSDNDKFCYIAGYTLNLDGFYINLEYNNKGIELMQKCYNESKDENLKALAKNFIENTYPNKKHKKLENVKTICNELFPSDSEIDTYFREIFSYKLKI